MGVGADSSPPSLLCAPLGAPWVPSAAAQGGQTRGERDGASQPIWASQASWGAGRHLVTEAPERPRKGSEQPLSPLAPRLELWRWPGPHWPHVLLYLGGGRVRGGSLLGTEAPPHPTTHCCDRLRSGQAPTNASCCSSSTMRRPMYPEDSSKVTMLGTGRHQPGGTGWGHGAGAVPRPSSRVLALGMGVPGKCGNPGPPLPPWSGCVGAQ